MSVRGKATSHEELVSTNEGTKEGRLPADSTTLSFGRIPIRRPRNQVRDDGEHAHECESWGASVWHTQRKRPRPRERERERERDIIPLGQLYSKWTKQENESVWCVATGICDERGSSTIPVSQRPRLYGLSSIMMAVL